MPLRFLGITVVIALMITSGQFFPIFGLLFTGGTVLLLFLFFPIFRVTGFLRFWHDLTRKVSLADCK